MIRALPLVLLLGACVPRIELELPDAPGAVTCIVVVERLGNATAHAFDLKQTRLSPMSLRDEDRVTVFLDDRTLEQLHIQPGPLEGASGASRPLPTPLAAYETTIPDGVWHKTEHPVSYPIAEVSPDACLKRGGCYDAGNRDELCITPCPEVTPPQPVEIAPFVFRSCPAGWRPQEVSDGLVRCDPLPDPVPSCSPFELIVPGSVACEPVGDPCQERFMPLLPVGTIYVDAAEPSGGDGTRLRPFNHLNDALPEATDGSTIALARGEQNFGSVRIAKSITIAGSCAGETKLSVGYIDASVSMHDLTLKNQVSVKRPLLMRQAKIEGEISVEGGAFRGERVIITHQLDLRHGSIVLLRSMGSGALIVNRGTIMLDTVLWSGDPGLQMLGGAGDLERVVFIAGATINLSGAELDISRVHIRGTSNLVSVGVGSSLAATDLEIWGVSGGLSVAGAGASAQIDGLLVHGGVNGVYVANRGQASFTNMLLFNLAGFGLFMDKEESQVTIHQGVVRDAGQTGVWVDGVVELRNVSVFNSQHAGVSVRPFSLVEAESVAIHGSGAFGIRMIDAEIRLRRAELFNNAGAGINLSNTVSHLQDIVVDTTGPMLEPLDLCANACLGTGIYNISFDTSELERFVVRNSAAVGIVASAPFSLVDGLIEKSPIGAELSDQTFDPNESLQRVIFRDTPTALTLITD